MTATVVRLPVIVRLECSSCGAAGEGGCNCGAPYLPAGAKAAAAIAANPTKSDRAIAEDIGVSAMTVNRARKSGVPDVTPETHVGRDGKSYPAHRGGDSDQTIWRRGLMFRAQDAAAGAAFENWCQYKVDRQIVIAAERAADAWKALAEYLRGRMDNGKTS